MRTVPYAPTHAEAADAYTLALLGLLAARKDDARRRVVTARQDRDDAIRAAVAAGQRISQVAQAAGLTPQRVGQILRGTR